MEAINRSLLAPETRRFNSASWCLSRATSALKDINSSYSAFVIVIFPVPVMTQIYHEELLQTNSFTGTYQRYFVEKIAPFYLHFSLKYQ